MAGNVTPISDAYALALTAAAQTITPAVDATYPTWLTVDYLVTIVGSSPCMLRTDGSAAVMPTTGNHQPGILIAGNSVQVISARPGQAFSVISTDTQSILYLQAVQQG